MQAIRYKVLIIVALQICVTACSTQQIARFETKVGAARCVKDQGLIEGSPAHQACVSAYAAAAERERTDTQAAMLGVIGAASNVRAAESQGRANAAARPNRAPPRSAIQTSGAPANPLVSHSLDSDWNYICQYADGTEVNSGKNPCPASMASAY